MTFRIHYLTTDGEKRASDVDAASPEQAAQRIRKEGAVILKIKRVKG